MRRIDGPGITAEVLENPFNDRRRLDAGDDPQAAAALVGFLANLLVPRSIDVGPQSPLGLALVINCGLILLFGLQHTVMARPAFKAAWTRVVPKPAERSTYVLISSLLLILLYWQWRPMTGIVWQAEAGWAQTALWAVFAAGMTGYILVAIRYEERDLEHFLGDDYRRYKARVPMLLPSVAKVHETVKPPPNEPLPH